MKCARPGCERTVPVGNSRFCGSRCSNLRNRPILRVVRPASEADYLMRCHHCGGEYDGRDGPWVGLCSVMCVGKHVMGAAAETRTRKVG